MFAIEVNGNRLHDEGEHEPGPEKVVKRAGGGPLTFATSEQASSFADALHATHEAQDLARGLRRARVARASYKVVPA